MPGVEHGCLLVADISGYTRFLGGVELEHSHDLLADLINTVVGQTDGVLRLAKLEGDAVFCVESGTVGGRQLLTVIDSCYFAFRKRLRDIRHLTTCACQACKQLPDLDLKVVVHRGDFVTHEVAGSREVVGNDVIVTHRLLKNHVTEQTGLRGYCLVTRTLVKELGLDVAGLGARPHGERYEDVGIVPGYVIDLAGHWQTESNNARVYVSSEDAPAVQVTVEAPPSVVWDWLSDPIKRRRWNGADRIESEDQKGRPGVGSVNHCVHGKTTIEEEVLDWRPFEYTTIRARMPLGQFVFTCELTPVEGSSNQTVLSARMRNDTRGPKRAVFGAVKPMITRDFKKKLDVLASMLREEATASVATERAPT